MLLTSLWPLTSCTQSGRSARLSADLAVNSQHSAAQACLPGSLVDTSGLLARASHLFVQEGRNAVLLDTVPYASNGSFAINLWMRRLPGSSYDGELHQYLYSHTGLEHATISGQVANKV